MLESEVASVSWGGEKPETIVRIRQSSVSWWLKRTKLVSHVNAWNHILARYSGQSPLLPQRYVSTFVTSVSLHFCHSGQSPRLPQRSISTFATAVSLQFINRSTSHGLLKLYVLLFLNNICAFTVNVCHIKSTFGLYTIWTITFFQAIVEAFEISDTCGLGYINGLTYLTGFPLVENSVYSLQT